MVLLPSIFGPAGLLSGFFLSPEKVPLALAFLVPLILLYLIKPKPVNVQVPSLMFILKDMGKSNVHRLFRTLFRDILFLIQLLVILLLAFSIAKPFIEVAQESLVEQSVLILDVSASTRASGGDVFERIQDAALDQLSNENVIILSRRNPVVLDEGGETRLSARDAAEAIRDLDPTDMPGDLPSALTLAERFVGQETKVVIISDLVLSGLEDPARIGAKAKVLKSKGALVDLHIVETGGKNVGIIDAQIDPNNATVTFKIQNFNAQPEEIGLEYNGKDVSLPANVLAPAGRPGSLLSVNVPLGHGRSEVTLTPRDDLAVDNKYFISVPEQDEVRVLVITNDNKARESKLIPALEAAGDQFTPVSVEYAAPPKVPDLQHDIYIIKDVNTQFVLPGVIRDLGMEAERGKVLIVFAQPGLFALDFLGNLPVQAKPAAEPLGGRQEILVNDSLSLMQGLSDIGQADGEQLMRVSPSGNPVVYASVATNDGAEPVIAARRLGDGAILYYGIMDRPEFDIDPQSYAIIWGRIVDLSLTDPMSLNIATGTIIAAGEEIRTPAGDVPSPAAAYRGGFYGTVDGTVAANLYPLHTTRASSIVEETGSSESRIAEPAEIDLEGISSSSSSQEEEAKAPRDISTLLIIAGLIVLILELVYVKYRGDM